MDGSQYSAMGVLPHPFHTPIESPTALGCNGSPCFHLSRPLHCRSSRRPQIWPEPKRTQCCRCFWPNMTWMAASIVPWPWECCHILSIPQWITNSYGLQWLALLPPQPTASLRELRAKNLAVSANTNTISEVLLAKYGMDDSQYSAMRVLPHPFLLQ